MTSQRACVLGGFGMTSQRACRRLMYQEGSIWLHRGLAVVRYPSNQVHRKELQGPVDLGHASHPQALYKDQNAQAVYRHIHITPIILRQQSFIRDTKRGHSNHSSNDSPFEKTYHTRFYDYEKLSFFLIVDPRRLERYHFVNFSSIIPLGNAKVRRGGREQPEIIGNLHAESSSFKNEKLSYL